MRDKKVSTSLLPKRDTMDEVISYQYMLLTWLVQAPKYQKELHPYQIELIEKYKIISHL